MSLIRTGCRSSSSGGFDSASMSPGLVDGWVACLALFGEDHPRTALKQDIGLVVTLVTTPFASFTVSPTQYSLIAKTIPPNKVITNPTPTANAIGGIGSDHGYLVSIFPTCLFRIE